jgi:DNA repair protein RAD50
VAGPDPTRYTKALDNIRTIRKERVNELKVDKERLKFLKADKDKAERVSWHLSRTSSTNIADAQGARGDYTEGECQGH